MMALPPTTILAAADLLFAGLSWKTGRRPLPVLARRSVQLALRIGTPMSYPELYRILGYKGHSGIIQSVHEAVQQHPCRVFARQLLYLAGAQWHDLPDAEDMGLWLDLIAMKTNGITQAKLREAS